MNADPFALPEPDPFALPEHDPFAAPPTKSLPTKPTPRGLSVAAVLDDIAKERRKILARYMPRRVIKHAYQASPKLSSRQQLHRVQGTYQFLDMLGYDRILPCLAEGIDFESIEKWLKLDKGVLRTWIVTDESRLRELRQVMSLDGYLLGSALRTGILKSDYMDDDERKLRQLQLQAIRDVEKPLEVGEKKETGGGQQIIINLGSALGLSSPATKVINPL